MTYEEFLEFVPAKCMYETIYDDSEGRTILVISLLDAYGMVNKAITALRLAIDVQNMASESTYKAALAQQAPTGMLHIDRLDKWLDASLKERKAQRTWVGLTDKDWNRSKHNYDFQKGVDWAESILKEKNCG